MRVAIDEQHRGDQHEWRDKREAECCILPPLRDATWQEPEQPQPNQYAREEKVVAGRDGLQRERCSNHHQPHGPPGVQPAMKREEYDRQPVGCEQLEVRQVLGAEGVEAEDQAAGKRGRAAPRDREAERVGRDCRQPIGGQERKVVRRHWRRAQPQRRRGDQAEADPMIRKRERVRRGIEEEAIPPPVRERQHAGVPPQDRGGQQRVAQVVRHELAGPERERPRQRDRDDQVECARGSVPRHYGMRTIFPRAPGSITFLCAVAACSNGSSVATTGVSAPENNPPTIPAWMRSMSAWGMFHIAMP